MASAPDQSNINVWAIKQIKQNANHHEANSVYHIKTETVSKTFLQFARHYLPCQANNVFIPIPPTPRGLTQTSKCLPSQQFQVSDSVVPQSAHLPYHLAHRGPAGITMDSTPRQRFSSPAACGSRTDTSSRHDSNITLDAKDPYGVERPRSSNP